MLKPTVLLLILFAFYVNQAMGQNPLVSFELEIGPVWQSLNDVQIPNTTAGTRFSLSGLTGKGPLVGRKVIRYL